MPRLLRALDARHVRRQRPRFLLLCCLRAGRPWMTQEHNAMMTATYSPDDNKLRLYASARLDADTYARVKAAGFIWAPKQELFVAPMWTPQREDLLIELCGAID